MKLHIFWYGFISDDGKSVSVGGVQTYLINLTKLFNEKGIEVHFYRAGNCDIENILYNIHFHVFKSSLSDRDLPHQVKAAFNHYKEKIDKQRDIVLFAEEHLSFKTSGYHVISLQHGIYWDKPDYRSNNSNFRFALILYRKIKETISLLRHSTYSDILVCVDYNYVNWYRALMPCTKTKLYVVPNFAPLFPRVGKPVNIVNIMFARRFVPFRGTRVFGTAIKRILREYENVHVTLAGWGSDETWLHEQLDGYGEKIEFTTYKSEESFQIHSDKHIAVVPTVGSEGTSLSLLEAMSSHCAVIGSDVGGITNIILDGYNGLMVPAGNSNSLYEAIKLLIDNSVLREKIAEKGYETIQESFSLDVWMSKWRRIIKEYVESINSK